MDLRNAFLLPLTLALLTSSTACDRDARKGPTATPAAAGAPISAAPMDKATGSHQAAPSAPVNPAGALPPGHPPIGGGLPPGHPPTSAASSSPSPPSSEGNTVSAMGYQLDAPKAWIREQPRSSMRLAQFRLPREKGDPRDGVCTVIVAGGDVASNVNRWRGQFQGKPEAALETAKVGELDVTIVSIAGTFMEQARPMAGGPGTPRENTIVLAMIAPLKSDSPVGRSLFVKAWGPAPTMNRYREDFKKMAASLRK